MGRARLTHDDVKGRLEGRGIYWAGMYENSTTRVRFGCKECGHEWLAIPGSVFVGSGCPSCFSKNKRGGKGVPRPCERGFNEILADHGDWLVMDVSTEKQKGETMLVDKSVYEELVGKVGRISAGGRGYAHCRIDGRGCLFHRILLNGVKEVDHVNGDKLDNRMINLRSAESWQNQSNRGARSTNVLGALGVSLTPTGRYRAQKKRGKVTVMQKNFDTLEEAIAARRAADLEHCGEFAPHPSMVGREEIRLG